MRISLRSVARAVVVLTMLGAPALVQAQAQEPELLRLFAFGDSLVDTGNALLATNGVVPPVQTYAAGHFSNGPVAFEYLWARLSGALPFITPSFLVPVIPPQATGAVSFAFGGSGSGAFTPSAFGNIPGLQTQVRTFALALQGRAAPGDALYAIWTGSNDYGVAPGQTMLPPETVVANIVAAIGALHQLGARYILVVNLPDLGAGPLLQPGSIQSELLTALSSAHNKLLKKALKDAEKAFPDLTVIEGDVTKVGKSSDGEFNVTTPLLDALVPRPPGVPPASVCILINPATCPAVPTFAQDAPYAFWDSEHPTTLAHERLSDALIKPVVKALRHPVTH